MTEYPAVGSREVKRALLQAGWQVRQGRGHAVFSREARTVVVDDDVKRFSPRPVTRVGTLFERTPEGTWVATCPSVAGAFAQGRTLAECRKQLRDAIDSLLEFASADDLADLVDGEATTVRAELLDVVVPDRADELITQAGIARNVQVTRQAVHRWVKRSDFPSSVERTPAGPLWRKSDVMKWLASGRRTAGRPSLRESWPPAGSGQAPG